VITAEREFVMAIEASNGDLMPRPLSLHICLPICTAAYLARLERELDLVARLFDRDREVIDIEFGATSLALVPPAAKSELLIAMRTQFHFSSAFQSACCENGPGTGRCAAGVEPDRIGFGAGAESRIGDSVFRNNSDLAAWQQAIDRGCLAIGPAARIDVPSRHVTTACPAFTRDRR
jgi:coproporphyrinogen III oxidase-like Fe-S oxidoreductase